MSRAAARVEGCKAIGEAARQLEKRLAGLPAQPIEVDLRAFGQMIVEWNDVQRTHTGQEVTGQTFSCPDYSGIRTTAPQYVPDGSAAGPTGMPSFGQARTSADQPQREAEQSARPFSPA